MKSSRTSILFAIAFLWSCAIGEAAPSDSFATSSNEVWSTFDLYVVQKHALAAKLAKKQGVEVPPQVEKFFAAAQKHDWGASSNLFFAMEPEARKETSGTALKPIWGAIHDTYGVYEVFHEMNPKFAKMFGAEIVQSIPAGSIYFGGTDGGRFLVSVFSKSHSQGRPFYTITQNALADPKYLGYVADMYGDKIHVADTNDYQKAYADYMTDAQSRILHDQTHPNEPRQIKPGEDVHFDEKGKVQVNGQVSVMAINGLITKTIFDKNPTNEFYVEESFPLDWMFPHLTPSGLILKINRAEVPELTADMLKQDHAFWSKASQRLIGNWITYDTPVKEVIEFAERVYLRHDFSGFKGDEDFVRDDAAQKAFSKLRSSIAGVYSWRLGQPPSGGITPPNFIASGENRSLIEREADFAFKQALALCPDSPEAVYRYVQFLVSARRVNDAIIVAETAQKLDPKNTSFEYLIKNLKNISAQSSTGANTEQVKADVAKLETDNPPGSTNFMQQFQLAQKLIQLGENDRAYEVLDGILANPHATIPMVMSVAGAYNKLGQPARLQKALEALTRLAPDSPEAWYDLAASHAMMEQNTQAMECLKKALKLNASRLAKDANGQDIRLTLKADPRFARLRETAEYKDSVDK
jgi:tetratricopeptide (TPR) repeat protein